MRFHGTAIAAGAAASAALFGAAAAQSFNVACVKGADERTIEIIAPGVVGASCDVQYARASGVKTPYHANNSPAFCEEKAGEIVAGLIGSGFACGPVGGPLTAEARPAPETASLAEPEPAPEPTPEPAPEPALQPNEIAAPLEAPAEAEAETTVIEDVIDDVAEAAAPALSEPEAPETPATLVGAAPIEEPFSATATATATPETSTLETFEAEPLQPIAVEETATDEALATPPSEPDATEEDTALLNEPSPHATVATRGPATLAGDDLEELQRAAEPIPTGRLVGAAPTTPAPKPVTEPAEAAPAPATTVTPAAVVAAAPAEPKSTPSSALRDPEEIIVATLHAQTAAWNEGNLQAFMETYWNDDDLKFVSGTAITKGWSPTMKRYRERYADESGLGQLSFEKTDVEMVTDDVAVVTGRFNHVKNEEASSGVFTLVMKRVGGVWRIVHDHTAGDAPKTQ